MIGGKFFLMSDLPSTLLYAALLKNPHKALHPISTSVRPSVRPVPTIYSKSESSKNFKFGGDMILDIST